MEDETVRVIGRDRLTQVVGGSQTAVGWVVTLLTADSDQIAAVVSGVGLSADKYHAYLAGEGTADYERAQDEAAADHIFGVRIFVFKNEPFWGYDRLPMPEQRLAEAGLKL